MTKLLATTTLLLTLVVSPLMAKEGDVYMCEMKVHNGVQNDGKINNYLLDTFSFKIGDKQILFSKGRGLYSGWKLDFEKQDNGRFFNPAEGYEDLFYAQNMNMTIWLRGNKPFNNFILKHTVNNSDEVLIVISECDKAF